MAGLGDAAVIDPDLAEWNYGEYEGLTPKQIHEEAPGWLIFQDGCPGGESPEQVGARWTGLSPAPAQPMATWRCSPTGMCSACSPHAGSGRRRARGSIFCWTRGTLCVLGYYRDVPAVKIWNGPLPGHTA